MRPLQLPVFQVLGSRASLEDTVLDSTDNASIVAVFYRVVVFHWLPTALTENPSTLPRGEGSGPTASSCFTSPHSALCGP